MEKNKNKIDIINELLGDLELDLELKEQDFHGEIQVHHLENNKSLYLYEGTVNMMQLLVDLYILRENHDVDTKFSVFGGVHGDCNGKN